MNAISFPLTYAFAEAIVTSNPTRDIPAMNAARTAIIDFLACAIAGAGDRTTGILAQAVGVEQPGEAILIGTSRRTDLLVAAVINAYAGHVLDYDDVHASVRGHPTTVIIPALLALAAERYFSAEQLIASYVVGLEAMARLGLSIGAKHYEKGFHATATLGPLGVAAAIAHLTRSPVDQTAVALGLAATQASGLRLQFGHDAKPYHAGMAARSGLLAARLADAGFGGAPDFLDNPVGFHSAYAFGAANLAALCENWGAPWQIVTPGLTLKAYPCCTASHPVAALGIDLHGEGLAADAIERITFTYPPGADAALVVISRPMASRRASARNTSLRPPSSTASCGWTTSTTGRCSPTSWRLRPVPGAGTTKMRRACRAIRERASSFSMSRCAMAPRSPAGFRASPASSIPPRNSAMRPPAARPLPSFPRLSEP